MADEMLKKTDVTGRKMLALENMTAFHGSSINELFDHVALMRKRLTDLEIEFTDFKSVVKATMDRVLSTSESTNKKILEKLGEQNRIDEGN
jgi:hypothetical protein